MLQVCFRAILFFCLLFLNNSLEAKEVLSQKSAKKAVEDTKLLGSQVNVAISSGEVQISGYVNRQKIQKDMKIDAVLLAKKIFDLDSVSINRVRVRFFDLVETNKYSEVTIRQGDVKAFGSGQINEDQLLGSIELTDKTLSGNIKTVRQVVNESAHSFSDPRKEFNKRRQAAAEGRLAQNEASMSQTILLAMQEHFGDLKPSPGYLLGQRMQIADRLAILKKSGYDISAYEKLFKDMETANIRHQYASVDKHIAIFFKALHLSKLNQNKMDPLARQQWLNIRDTYNSNSR